MKMAVISTAILAMIMTMGLLYKAFFPHYILEFYVFIGLGILCILAAVGYTMGKKPYGYLGLGDIMVFIFFGWISVGGSYFLFTKVWSWDILLPASAIGMLSVAVLNLNNMRDLESDKLAGKNTLALRLGFKRAMIYQIVLMQLPLILVLIFLLKNELQIKGNYYAFMVMVLFFPMTRSSIISTDAWEMAQPLPVKEPSVIVPSSSICKLSVILSPQLGLMPFKTRDGRAIGFLCAGFKLCSLRISR